MGKVGGIFFSCMKWWKQDIILLWLGRILRREKKKEGEEQETLGCADMMILLWTGMREEPRRGQRERALCRDESIGCFKATAAK